MLCIMADATPKGHLLVNGRPPTDRQLASVFGLPEKDARSYLKELEDAGVFSRTADGVIFNRRMVRDRAASERAVADGKRGGNPNLKKGIIAPVNGGGNPGGLTPTVNQGGYPLEAEAEAEFKKQEAEPAASSFSRSSRAKMPRRSDPAHLWADFAEKWEVDEKMVKRPVLAGFHFDIVCEAACEAARIPDSGWRGDWHTVAQWLRDGLLSDHIIAAIKNVAERPRYQPPNSLFYFDRPVRDYRPGITG